MDLSLPGAGGLEAVRHIRQWDKRARILVFTMHSGAAFALKAFEAGASGYVTKSSDATELIRAVAIVAQAAARSATTSRVRSPRERLAEGRSPLDELGPRETEILRLRRLGPTTEEIADLLNLSTKTVQNYHYQIKSKIGARTDAHLVWLAIGAGLVNDDRPDRCSTGSTAVISIPKPDRPTKARGLGVVRAQADRGHAQILQDLRAEAHVEPLPLAGLFGVSVARPHHIGGHARRAVAQIDQHAAALAGEARQRLLDRRRAAHHVGEMSARCSRAGTSRPSPIAPSTKGEMLHAVEGRDIGVAGQRPRGSFDRKGRHALHQLFARLPVGDEIGDRDHLELVRGARIR